jgi:hypothetical protein
MSFLIYLLCFLFNKIWEQEDGAGSAWIWGWRGDAQTMHTYVSKCKNDKKDIFAISGLAYIICDWEEQRQKVRGKRWEETVTLLLNYGYEFIFIYTCVCNSTVYYFKIQ